MSSSSPQDEEREADDLQDENDHHQNQPCLVGSGLAAIAPTLERERCHAQQAECRAAEANAQDAFLQGAGLSLSLSLTTTRRAARK